MFDVQKYFFSHHLLSNQNVSTALVMRYTNMKNKNICCFYGQISAITHLYRAFSLFT